MSLLLEAAGATLSPLRISDSPAYRVRGVQADEAVLLVDGHLRGRLAADVAFDHLVELAERYTVEPPQALVINSCHDFGLLQRQRV